MTTLSVPLHLPMLKSQELLQSQLRGQEVKSVKVHETRLIIEYERKTNEVISIGF